MTKMLVSLDSNLPYNRYGHISKGKTTEEKIQDQELEFIFFLKKSKRIICFLLSFDGQNKFSICK